MADLNRTVNIQFHGEAGRLVAATRQSNEELKKLQRAAAATSKAGRDLSLRNTDLAQTFTNAATAAAVLDGPLGGVAGRLSSIGSALRNVNPLMIAFGISAAGMVAGTGFAIAASSELEAQLLKLEGVLYATDNAAQQSVEGLDEFARALDAATLGSASELRDAAAVLLTFKTISGETFKETLTLAQDMASVFGSVKSSVLQLGKALEEPVTGLTALRRAGVTFSTAEKELIKTLAETNRLAEAQGIILERVSAQVGGVAAIEARGFAGAVDGLNKSWTELLETVGDQGVLDAATEGVKGLATSLEVLADVLPDLIDGVQVAAVAVGSLLIARRVGPALAVAAAGLQLVNVAASITVPLMKGVILGFAAVGTAGARAAIGASALAGATRLLSGSLALVGGPAGLAILAGIGLFAYANRTREADEATKLLKTTFDELKGSADAVVPSLVTTAEKQLVLARSALASAQAEAEASFRLRDRIGITTQAQTRLSKLQAVISNLTAVVNANTKAERDAALGNEALREAVGRHAPVVRKAKESWELFTAEVESKGAIAAATSDIDALNVAADETYETFLRLQDLRLQIDKTNASGAAISDLSALNRAAGEIPKTTAELKAIAQAAEDVADAARDAAIETAGFADALFDAQLDKAAEAYKHLTDETDNFADALFDAQLDKAAEAYEHLTDETDNFADALFNAQINKAAEELNALADGAHNFADALFDAQLDKAAEAYKHLTDETDNFADALFDAQIDKVAEAYKHLADETDNFADALFDAQIDKAAEEYEHLADETDNFADALFDAQIDKAAEAIEEAAVHAGHFADALFDAAKAAKELEAQDLENFVSSLGGQVARLGQGSGRAGGALIDAATGAFYGSKRGGGLSEAQKAGYTVQGGSAAAELLGGQNAGIGAGIGGTLGGIAGAFTFTPFGAAAGAAAGTFLGGFAGSVLGSDEQVPRLSVGTLESGSYDASGRFGQRSVLENSPFGQVFVGGSDGQDRTRGMFDLADSIVDLDTTIAGLTDDAGVGRASTAVQAFSTQTDTSDLDVDQLIAARTQIAFDAIGGELDAAYDLLVDGLDATAEEVVAATSLIAQLQTDLEKGEGFASFEGFPDTVDGMVVSLKKFQKEGEDIGVTYIRVAQEMSVVSDSFEFLGISLSATGPALAESTQAIVEFSGGLSQFTDNVAFYHDNFFTAEEKINLARTAAQKTVDEFEESMADLGLQVDITDKQSLRNFIEGLDENSEAFDEATAAALSTTRAVAILDDELEAVADTIRAINVISVGGSTDLGEQLGERLLGGALQWAEAAGETLTEDLQRALPALQERLAAVDQQIVDLGPHALQSSIRILQTARRVIVDEITDVSASLEAIALLEARFPGFGEARFELMREFSDLFTGALEGVDLENARDAFANAWEAILEAGADATKFALDGIVQDITGYLAGLVVSDLSPLSPQEQLAAAEGTFESTLAAAQAGDPLAAQQLTGAADSFLSEARDFFASGSGFADIFNEVTTALADFGTELGTDAVADAIAAGAEEQAAQMQSLLEELQRIRGVLELSVSRPVQRASRR